MTKVKKAKETYSLERWNEIHEDYIRGIDSLEAIAIKHNMPVSTVKNRAHGMRWAKDRKEYQERKIQAAMSPQPGVLPPINPPRLSIAQMGRYPDMTADEWTDRHKQYIHEGFRLLDLAGEVVEGALIDCRAAGTRDEKLIGGLVSSLNILMERRRILMGIPLVAPIKRNDKNVKRGSDVIPIESESCETIDRKDPVLPDNSPVDSPAGLEVEEVQSVRDKSDEWA
jgi:hypothetical protein